MARNHLRDIIGYIYLLPSCLLPLLNSPRQYCGRKKSKTQQTSSSIPWIDSNFAWMCSRKYWDIRGKSPLQQIHIKLSVKQTSHSAPGYLPHISPRHLLGQLPPITAYSTPGEYTLKRVLTTHLTRWSRSSNSIGAGSRQGQIHHT